MRLTRDGRLPLFHPEAINARRAAAGDREAGRNYRRLAALTGDPEVRRDWLRRARESFANARTWNEEVRRDRR